MLYGLESGLQRRFERHGPYEMFQELKLIFQANTRVERYEISNKYFSYKMEENSSTSEHVLRWSEHYNRLSQVGVNLPDKIVIDRVLESLSPSYWNFVMNYNMQGMTKTIPVLFVMLKSTKVEIKKSIKCWWLTRPLVTSKRERKGTSTRMANKLPLPWRSPKLDPSLKLSASTSKGLVTGSGTAPSIWQSERYIWYTCYWCVPY